ncbi:MAG: DUF2164 domain-containing protein [Gemmatimonadaceae bacterium]|jgi:uncharacterized protein (DUF2164 family)|nr:DUF2164 domain-containing protein [Gemmatimonadaceae bacterium]
MPSAPPLAFPDDARPHAIATLRQHVASNLDLEIGELKATLLLDWIAAELGPTIYNQAIADARAFFDARVADLAAVCYRDEFPSMVKRKR